MRRFGMSAAVVLACTAPAWGQYPPAIPDGPPAPLGYPTVAPPPVGYLPPGYVPAGFAEMPGYGYLPPIGQPPGPPAPPSGTRPDPNGFPFDPCYEYQRSPIGRVSSQAWIRGDWLYWHFRDAPVPALIVGGDTNLPAPGIPGGGNASPLVGPSRNLGTFNGVRATFGQWFDPDGELGGELSAFVFGREGTRDAFTNAAGRTLSVPVFGTNGLVGVYDFSFPNRFSGALALQTSTFLWGGEANLLHRWCGNGCFSVDGLIGYRYLQLDERIDLLGRAQSVGAPATFQGMPLPAGAVITTRDSFRARTDFNGAQIGARLEARRSMFTVTAFGKGGAGVNVQTLRVEGVTQSGSSVAYGGVRGLPSNIGRDTNTDFSMIGEVGFEVGLQVTKNLSLRAGYNALWWSDVLRPGSVISPVATLPSVPIDPTFNGAVPATRPMTSFRSSDFLAHGLVVGVLVEW